MNKQDDTQLLTVELVGWTIADVEDLSGPDGREELFALLVRQDARRKRVVIAGTELGWWVARVEALPDV